MLSFCGKLNPFRRANMIPKYGPKPIPSIAPQVDDLILYLNTLQTFNSTTKCPISLSPDDDAKYDNNDNNNDYVQQNNIINDGGPTDTTIYSVSNSTSIYTTDLKNKETSTMKMIINECNTRGLTSYRLNRVPSSYYDGKIEWRRDILSAPHIKYLCKTLLMKNIRCTVNDCSDPTNSLYYLVVFQYITRINSEKIMKFARKIHGFKLGKKKFKFRLAQATENDEQTGFKHNAVTPIGIKNKDIPIILSDRLLKLDHFWMGGGEHDVKLAVDVNQFRNIYRPYVADIVYDGEIDPNVDLDDADDNIH